MTPITLHEITLICSSVGGARVKPPTSQLGILSFLIPINGMWNVSNFDNHIKIAILCYIMIRDIPQLVSTAANQGSL